MQRIVIGVLKNTEVINDTILSSLLGKLKARKKQCCFCLYDILKFSFINFFTIYFLDNDVLQDSLQTLFFSHFTFLYLHTPIHSSGFNHHLLSDDFHLYISRLDLSLSDRFMLLFSC